MILPAAIAIQPACQTPPRSSLPERSAPGTITAIVPGTSSVKAKPRSQSTGLPEIEAAKSRPLFLFVQVLDLVLVNE